MVRRKTIVTAILAACFMLGCFGSAYADDRDHDRDRKCERKIHAAEENLRKAEAKHGEHSRQADKKRHELEEARERCRPHDGDKEHH